MRKWLLALAIVATQLGGWNLWTRAADESPASPQAAPLFTVTAPLDYQVIQRRTAREGALPVAGRCTVACDRVEVRVAGKTMEGKPLATEWADTKRDAASGEFKTELSTPAGGWYVVALRAVKRDAAVAEVKIPHVGIGEVFVGTGQSNSTSCGGLGSKSPLDGRTKPTSGMVSTFDGHAWRIADDPQPGAHDIGKYTFGSFWPAFGDAMAARFKVPIGVAVTGHGGTSIKTWSRGGELFRWSLTRMNQLGKNGFRAVLWHQGESDALMPAAQYADGLAKIIEGYRQQAGWPMPWFVAHASFRPGKPLNEAGSRGGQKMLWDRKVALEGPDTDHMLGDLRDHDGKGIHFSKKGLKVHGEAWAEKIGPWLQQQLDQQK